MDNLALWWKRVQKRRFVRYGIPFMIVIIGGSKGLEYFASVRYEFRTGKMLTYEEGEKFGIKLKRKEEKPSLESEYEALQQRLSEGERWENVRGPRPWENSKAIQDQQRLGTNE